MCWWKQQFCLFRFWRSLCGVLVLAAALLGAAEPKDTDLKARGPEHNVTLAEEPGVLELLAKAQKARAKAEQDPQAWPECVKFYGEILRKFSNSVYLDRWEGPDKKDLAYKNGLYKPTRERVAAEIASLPPAGLAIYRVINDPPARALFFEAKAELDVRKMEQVARDYFATSWGDQALAWLAEVDSGRHAPREALAHVSLALKHPGLNISMLGLLVRQYLAQLELGDANAEKTLQGIEGLLPVAKEGELRAGHATGRAALDKLRARLAAAPAAPLPPAAAAERSWPTYFGNAAHNRNAPARRNVGLRKWSEPIAQLLYGANAEHNAVQKIFGPDGQPVPDPTINCHLAVQAGFFYLCDAQVVAAYPLGNPQPGGPGAGGNAKFLWPSEPPPAKPPSRQQQMFMRFGGRGQSNARHRPLFCTLGGDRLYFACGAETPMNDYNNFFGGNQEQKENPNFLAALGKQDPGGALESGKLVWSLQPDSHAPAFEAQSKADQEWLKTVFFVSAPTWDAEVLYALAVRRGGLTESWAVAVDAATGRLLWRTQICAANPIAAGGLVQPARGLPVAVADGTVYAVTNLGAVAALEAMTGAVKWIRIYDRLPTPERFNQFGLVATREFWGPNPPIVYENLLIATPQDSELLYVYDIETGRRLWHTSRTERDPGLKHILGISNGVLVVTGTNVHFYELKGGRETGPAEPLSFDSPIKGRGLMAGNVVLVPTANSLAMVDTALVDGKFRPSIVSQYKWTEPEREAGNVFVAGDVLYTVSNTHVNAYFVWEEMEARLKQRLAQNPGDLGAYSELADVYQRVERFEQALALLDQALQIAEKTKDDVKTAAALVELNSRRFDALLELGRARQKGTAAVAPDLEASYDCYKKALEVARLPAQAETLPVIALRAMAENRTAKKELELAVAHYQQIITRYGEVVCACAPESPTRARLFAAGRIEELRKQDPACYEKVEAAAKAALAKAGNDTRQLETLLEEYPNAEACGSALLGLARLLLDKKPDQARQYAQRFLGRYPQSPQMPAVTGLLAVAYERSGLLRPARDILRRLASRPEFAGKTLAFDPRVPDSGQGAAGDAAQWAVKQLAEPQFQRPISDATASLGDGRLKEAWTKTAGEQSVPLLTEGLVPAGMRRNLFYVENQSELAVLSGTDKGEELWLPRPKLPADCIPKPNLADPNHFRLAPPGPVGFWAEHLLIVAGRRELMAYDSLEKGRLVWRKELKFPVVPPQQQCWLQVSSGRLVIAYSVGALSVVDPVSGKELWTQSETASLPACPALGEGFVAAAVEAWQQQPRRIIIYDLETGARRAAVETGSAQGLLLAAAGDRLYFAVGRDGLKAVDSATGKLLWEEQTGGVVRTLKATMELVVAVTDNHQVVAFSTGGAAERKKWSPVLPLGATVTGVHIDGEDLYVVAQALPQKPKLIAFSIPKEGKILWDVELAADPLSALPLCAQTVASGHLVVTESNWDPSGDKPCAVAVVDRRTGKLTTSKFLSSEPLPQFNVESAPLPPFRVQVFDGGMVVTEARRRVAYLAQDARNLDELIAALAEQAAKNPNDLGTRVNLATKRFEKGEREKGLQELSALLSQPALSAEAFADVFAELARLRKQRAEMEKRAFSFSRVADGSKLEAAPAAWAGVPETVLRDWRDVYFPSDDPAGGDVKKSSWAGPDDLRVSFRGAYDEQNLYLLFDVTDDKHKNDAAEANCCDLGDSVRLLFDIGRDGGVGFRGEAFEMGAGLSGGNVLSWRWVEHGKYLAGNTPLEPCPIIVRNEATKQTVYKFTLPLAYLRLKPAPGLRFGFSFAVNDQDEGEVTKSMCASPGALRPVIPGLFSEGVLEEKK